eukprot:6200572-Pleurochrysis_carterae.AAC.2
MATTADACAAHAWAALSARSRASAPREAQQKARAQVGEGTQRRGGRIKIQQRRAESARVFQLKLRLRVVDSEVNTPDDELAVEIRCDIRISIAQRRGEREIAICSDLTLDERDELAQDRVAPDDVRRLGCRLKRAQQLPRAASVEQPRHVRRKHAPHRRAHRAAQVSARTVVAAQPAQRRKGVLRRLLQLRPLIAVAVADAVFSSNVRLCDRTLSVSVRCARAGRVQDEPHEVPHDAHAAEDALCACVDAELADELEPREVCVSTSPDTAAAAMITAPFGLVVELAPVLGSDSIESAALCSSVPLTAAETIASRHRSSAAIVQSVCSSRASSVCKPCVCTSRERRITNSVSRVLITFKPQNRCNSPMFSSGAVSTEQRRSLAVSSNRVKLPFAATPMLSSDAKDTSEERRSSRSNLEYPG